MHRSHLFAIRNQVYWFEIIFEQREKHVDLCSFQRTVTDSWAHFTFKMNWKRKRERRTRNVCVCECTCRRVAELVERKEKHTESALEISNELFECHSHTKYRKKEKEIWTNGKIPLIATTNGKPALFLSLAFRKKKKILSSRTYMYGNTMTIIFHLTVRIYIESFAHICTNTLPCSATHSCTLTISFVLFSTC